MDDFVTKALIYLESHRDFCDNWSEMYKNRVYSPINEEEKKWMKEFNKEYLTNTTETAGKCIDRDLSADYMIIGTSTIVETEIEGAVNIYSGFNNPFIVWGRYSKTLFRYHMMLSFQFHHTQMDGAHAGRFLQNLQNEIDSFK